MHRRSFLKLTATMVASPLLVTACDPKGRPPPGYPDAPPPVDADAFDQGVPSDLVPEAVPIDEVLFFVGVQAGSPTAGSVRLWTRVPDPALALAPISTLRLLVWRDTQSGEGIILVKDIEAAVGADGTTVLAVDGLAPSTLYRYAFIANGAEGEHRSIIGQVRTAWAEDWEWPVVVGSTTCTKYDQTPFTTLEVLAKEPLDVFVHTGDMVYADGSDTRADYRQIWETSLKDPGYRALLASVGGIYAWDDHEFDNNFNPETMDPAKLAAGRDEFYANTPMVPNPSGQLWQSFVWGRTLEIFVLDCRTERKPSTRKTEAPIYISLEQMAWLKDRLLASPARFKAIVNSVPMTRMTELFPSAGDRWEGYEAQRNELLGFIEQNALDNIWFLSGDFHLGFVGRVEPTGFHRHTYEAAVGPGGNLGNPLGFLASQEEYREQVFPADQFFYGQGVLAATTLTFDPLRNEVRVRYLGKDGEVLFDDVISKRS